MLYTCDTVEKEPENTLQNTVFAFVAKKQFYKTKCPHLKIIFEFFIHHVKIFLPCQVRFKKDIFY